MTLEKEVMPPSTLRLTINIGKHRKGKKTETVPSGESNFKMHLFLFIKILKICAFPLALENGIVSIIRS